MEILGLGTRGDKGKASKQTTIVVGLGFGILGSWLRE